MTHPRTPHDTFLSDQALAHAREQSRVPGTLAVVIDYATSGQCSWCDCPDDGRHDIAGYTCAGCPRDAHYLVHAQVNPAKRFDFPVCVAHKEDVRSALTSLVRQQPPGGAR
jgi:hypothetical protein